MDRRNAIIFLVAAVILIAAVVIGVAILGGRGRDEGTGTPPVGYDDPGKAVSRGPDAGGSARDDTPESDTTNENGTDDTGALPGDGEETTPPGADTETAEPGDGVTPPGDGEIPSENVKTEDEEPGYAERETRARAVVYGTVTDAETGEPIRDVYICFNVADPGTGETTGDIYIRYCGETCFIEALNLRNHPFNPWLEEAEHKVWGIWGGVKTGPHGRYELSVYADEPLFISAHSNKCCCAKEKTQALSENGRLEVNFQLEKFPCSVTGSVTDAETGEVLTSVGVFMRRVSGEIAPDWLNDYLYDRENTARDFSECDGSFAHYADPGPYALLVRHPRYKDYIGESFSLAEDETKTVEIELVPYPEDEREIDFGGTVTDGQTGLPLEGVAVRYTSFRGGGMSMSSTVATGPDGKYGVTFPVNAPVMLKFEKEGYEPNSIRPFNPIHEDWIKGDIALLRIGGGPKKGEGRVTGTVCDAVTGNPLEDVTFTVIRGFGRTDSFGWRTDAEGKYRIDLRPYDDAVELIRVVVAVPGFAKYVSLGIRLTPDYTLQHDIFLQPETFETAFTGYVADAGTAAPIKGAKIEVRDIFGDVVASGTSGADGRYKVKVPAGECEVWANAEGYAEQSDEEGGFEIAQGETITVDFALARMDSIVGGVVKDAVTGEPIHGVTVMLFTMPNWSFPGRTAVTDSKGGFLFEVTGGDYIVGAYVKGYAPGYSTLALVPSGGRDRADVLLDPANCAITGLVTDAATGREMPEAADSVDVFQFPDEDAEENMPQIWIENYPVIETDGARFTIRTGPGKYNVSLSRRGYAPYKEEIVLEPGETLELDIRLGRK